MPRDATIAQCVIDARIPVSCLSIAGRPLLVWQMRDMLRFGVGHFVVLAYGMGPEMRDTLTRAAELLPRRVRLTFSDSGPATPGLHAALLNATPHLDDRFLLCDGARLFAGNLAALLRDSAADGPEVVVRQLFCSSGDTGISACDHRMIDALFSSAVPAEDIVPGGVPATMTTGWCLEHPSAADMQRMRTEMAAVLDRPALFLDRDGVLNHDHGYVGTPERWDWIDGALDAIRNATDRGWHVFVVTNQSGVARGYYSEDDARNMLFWLAEKARRHGGTIDDFRFCPYHPEAPLPAYRRDSDWRKPAPGMLLNLLRQWNLNPARCLMVGDKLSDRRAGEAAGMRAVVFPGGNLDEFMTRVMEGGVLF